MPRDLFTINAKMMTIHEDTISCLSVNGLSGPQPSAGLSYGALKMDITSTKREEVARAAGLRWPK